MENIYNYKTAVIPASFKDADLKTGIVTGYFSAFGNVDSDGDIVMPGAFSKTIIDRGPDSRQPRIKHLLNHRPEQPLGKIQVLKEDATGLYYESKIGNHTAGKEFIKMVESDLITEHSIGYRVIKSEPGNKLTELQLWEGSSLTSWGANENTPLTGIKQKAGKSMAETLLLKHAAIERFCVSADITDETIESLLLYNKQLFQAIINLTNETTQPAPGATTVPDNKCEGEWIEGFESIYSQLNIPTHGTDRSKSRITTYQ
jgi:hypothetical protein